MGKKKTVVPVALVIRRLPEPGLQAKYSLKSARPATTRAAKGNALDLVADRVEIEEAEAMEQARSMMDLGSGLIDSIVDGFGETMQDGEGVAERRRYRAVLA